MDERNLRRALARYPQIPHLAPVSQIGGGLINLTYAVGDDLILQRVNPIFAPEIHDNIEAVTQQLLRQGMKTPVLLKTGDDLNYVVMREDESEQARQIWRVMTRVQGCTDPTVGAMISEVADAEQAGLLVGRWHRALEPIEHRFVGLRAGVHDTPAHLATLRRALRSYRDHPRHAEVEALGIELLGAAGGLPIPPVTDDQICHGDLKFNNLVFHEGRAAALIDLDTVGPMPLAHELGDAWRSWCHPGAEDDPQATFDLEIFAASWRGYQEGRGGSISPVTRQALLQGVEWISLELAVRFAADALIEGYFGWDEERYDRASDHNLARAEGQWALHRAILDTRRERAAILDLTARSSTPESP